MQTQSPKQPSLIDLWTAEDDSHAKQEGWALVAYGNDGGKWTICAVGDRRDKEMELLVVERAHTSLRHWLAAVICRLISAYSVITPAPQRGSDGTTIANIIERNQELTAEVADLKRRMREIISICR